ncbi:MAG: Flp pilus assembly complex ATPase component TadA, partial [Deltaproteobacteria bacterium]|nr:Flp pilus assembly complex ATPase component TadA [Deltaproteobacteria bacterium]
MRELAVKVSDGTVFSSRGSVVIGREDTCDVVLHSHEVSRCHATIDPHPDGYLLTDSSANGTYVGAELVHRRSVRLDPKLPLSIGPFRIRLVVLDSTSPENLVAGEVEAPGAPVAPEPSGMDQLQASGVPSPLRRRVHRMLLDQLDLVKLDHKAMNEQVMRPKVREALRRICGQLASEFDPATDMDLFVQEMIDEALGLGPLEPLLADETVSEVMVVNPQKIFVERAGMIYETGLQFTDDASAKAVIERIVTPLGRRIDESTPLVDARLKDGSRVNAVIRPLALGGACITIRKFAKEPLTLKNLIDYGALTPQMAKFLTRSVAVRKNILISGGTGSGKTTLLNVLSGAIPERERIVTIEDAAELRLSQPHVVSLESRPPNLEGKGEITIRDLVRNALRMRPDRIVVGECRGGEAVDMLQAMNTGHEGSMTTVHSNSPREALTRLETLCLMAGMD